MTPCCNLLIDADDTLWENNIYFERVIAAVQALLLPLGVEPQDFRMSLNDWERKHIPIYGYGALNFTRSLLEAFEAALAKDSDPDLREKVQSLAHSIMDHPLELIDGVPETLAYLAGRHSLFLVTKGDPAEQTRKIDLSNLRHYFRKVEILPEKNECAYKELLAKHAWNPEQTWMIGNSPRSDVNPAISAGLNAVYIPHPHTWVLEHEDALEHPRLVLLERFSDLRSHF